MAISVLSHVLGLEVPGSLYVPQAESIFTAFTTPPTDARKALINTCVSALISAGIWPELDRLFVMAAADRQAGVVDWKNPSGTPAVEANAPTFVADRGFTGDGISSRVNTQFTPSTQGVKFTQNSASLWVWTLTDAANNLSDIGSLVGNISRIVTRSAADALVARVNDNTGDSVANASSLGLFGATRRSAADKRSWKNGVQQRSDVTASTGVADAVQWLCGASTTAFATKQEALGAWGSDLAGKELAFYTIMLAYMQGVGAA